jgi:four helix bundle protein
VARSYRELLVWQKAEALAVQIYQATEQFPKNETYDLTSQVRRAAVSVASNIAEGHASLT